jgi:4-hydroxybenzoyl-CoA reductase subunit beta
MMRLPRFSYRAPETIAEAADLLASAPPGGVMVLAGGTDLLPNMKRRQQTPAMLVGLRRIGALRRLRKVEDGFSIGAGVTLTELVQSAALRRDLAGLWQAAAQVATPHLRNMGTLGGNLCLDTRCNYYDQSYEWRKAIDFCMKRDGKTCWVATSSPRCLAVSSTDTAPILVALGATVTLASAAGERRLDLTSLYANDGIHYLTRRADELLTEIQVPAPAGTRSAYWKLRRRGAFDFPVLSVAVVVRLDSHGAVEAARLVLGAVASRPVEAERGAAALIGQPLSDAVIEAAAELAAVAARPMDNTDFSLVWRKRMARELVSYALREVRGDDVRELRTRISRNALLVTLAPTSPLQ